MGNIHVVCQHCGIGLEVEDDVTSFNCPNCGSIVHIRFQTQKETRSIPYGENNYNRTQQMQKKNFRWIPAIIFTIVLCIGIGIYIGNASNMNPPDVIRAVITPKPVELVKWPLSYKEAKKLSVSNLKEALQKAGFTNIKETAIPLPKIRIGINSGDIKEIQVAVKGNTYRNNQIKTDIAFYSDDEVIITYYK